MEINIEHITMPMELVEFTGGEDRYTITPKGIAFLELINCGLIDDLDDERAERFWDKFELGMYKHGYIRNDETKE